MDTILHASQSGSLDVENALYEKTNWHFKVDIINFLVYSNTIISLWLNFILYSFNIQKWNSLILGFLLLESYAMYRVWPNGTKGFG